jgi:hypothetical protein
MSPIYVPGKVLLANNYVGIDDPDAAAYITAVETADGQSLETAVKVAIHSFVKGCKADGIWPAIKASCILAGARTLAGALVPLVGTAPTNVGPFVAGDYNRETGLIGDGSTKYLDSNRNNNADPQNSKHISTYISNAGTVGAQNIFIGGPVGAVISSQIGNFSDGTASAGVNNTLTINLSASYLPGFWGASRAAAVNIQSRRLSTTSTITESSGTPSSGSLLIFSRGTAVVKSNARLAFYSIGESLDLALLDARVTDLINAIAAAIP